ncbi:hypothetical protein PT7_0600 [Pusillimonas sp. T7-7]|nr:hypothetical protein PT7_0600 [Pusillimonas sp. T7-7]
MGISHGRFQVLMTKYPLQGQNISAIDHEVAGESVAQHMG